MEVTYKIIGGDGAEYGPVAMDELKRWIVDGRVAPTTNVWRSDLGRWGPASEYAELDAELEQLAQAVPASAQAVGFWPRLGAYLIDGLVLQGIFSAIWGLTPVNIPKMSNGLPDLEAMVAQLGPQLVGRFLIQMAYSVFMNGQFGATLGKLAIGARIVNLDGSRIGFGKAFVRFLGTLLSQLTLFIGYLMVAVREDKRALHDLIAKTRVVYRR
jgi:uncharacterized RDD family membrane protein YckC